MDLRPDNQLPSLFGDNHELNRARDGEERQVRFTQSRRGGGGGRGGGSKRGKRGGRGRGKEKDEEDGNAKGEGRKRGSGHFETKFSVNVHPDIWSALTEDAKGQLAAARREVIRKAKAAQTEGDSPKDNKDSSSPYLMTNSPTYVEGGQCARTTC